MDEVFRMYAMSDGDPMGSRGTWTPVRSRPLTDEE